MSEQVVRPSGDEFLVNTLAAYAGSQPEVARLENGNFVITWMSGSYPCIKAQMYASDGSKIGSEFQVNGISPSPIIGASTQQTPVVTGLKDGGFVIAWTETVSGSDDIWAQMFASDGSSIGRQFRLNSVSTGTQGHPSITALAGGGFVAVWEDFSAALGDTSRTGIAAQIFDAAGNRIGTEFLVNTQKVNYQNSPVVTALANGNFVVSWTDTSSIYGDGSSECVKAQIFGPGGALVGSEFIVNAQVIGAQNAPAITALENGGFVATWLDNAAVVKGQVFDASGGKVGGELQAASIASVSQSAPAVSSLANGGFVIAWQDASTELGDGSASGIRAQVFDASGARQGSEFLVNTQTTDEQNYPSVAALDNGSFIITWVDVGISEGSGLGSIKAQIFTFDVSGHAPVIVSDGGTDTAAISLDENTAIVTRVLATDADPDAQLVFHIDGGEDAALFQIDPATGWLSFLPSISSGIYGMRPNFEAPADANGDNVYHVNVRAFDGTLVDTQALTITIGNVVNETISGTPEIDMLRGSDGNDTIFGLGGDDNLAGGDGLDAVFGGDGNDTIEGSGADSLDGGAGNDRLVAFALGADSGTSVAGGDGTDVLEVWYTVSLAAMTGIEVIELGPGAALTLTGSQFYDGLPLAAAIGSAGSASITVNMDPDVLFISKLNSFTGTIAMTVNGTSGTDIMKLGNVAHTANGGDGIDQIKGGSGADTIDGGAGIDRINGAGGADVLTGGADADVFKYANLSDSGTGAAADHVTDFVIGTDRLNFKTIDPNAVTAGDQAFAFIGTTAFHASGAAEIRYLSSGADIVVQLDADGNGTADMEVVLNGLAGQTMTVADFVL